MKLGNCEFYIDYGKQGLCFYKTFSEDYFVDIDRKLTDQISEHRPHNKITKEQYIKRLEKFIAKLRQGNQCTQS